jgi:tetratricopeptide (TPR) repeat protein
MGFSPLTRVLQYRGGLFRHMGRLPEAATDMKEALTLARRRAEPETVSWTLALLPQLAWLAGEGDDTLATAAEAVRLAEDTGNAFSLVLALEGLAVAHLAAGRPVEAVFTFERALAEAREHRSGLFEEAALLAYLARAQLAADNAAGAATAADEAVTVARRQGARVAECVALLTLAQVLRATEAPGAGEVALGHLEAALHLARDTGAATYEPFIREEFGRLRGDENELREALHLYSAIGATGHARRLQAEIEALPHSVPTVTGAD